MANCLFADSILRSTIQKIQHPCGKLCVCRQYSSQYDSKNPTSLWQTACLPTVFFAVRFQKSNFLRQTVYFPILTFAMTFRTIRFKKSTSLSSTCEFLFFWFTQRTEKRQNRSGTKKKKGPEKANLPSRVPWICIPFLPWSDQGRSGSQKMWKSLVDVTRHPPLRSLADGAGHPALGQWSLLVALGFLMVGGGRCWWWMADATRHRRFGCGADRWWMSLGIHQWVSGGWQLRFAGWSLVTAPSRWAVNPDRGIRIQVEPKINSSLGQKKLSARAKKKSQKMREFFVPRKKISRQKKRTNLIKKWTQMPMRREKMQPKIPWIWESTEKDYSRFKGTLTSWKIFLRIFHCFWCQKPSCARFFSNAKSHDFGHENRASGG